MPTSSVRSTGLLVLSTLLCTFGGARPAAAQPFAYTLVTQYRNDTSPVPQKLVVIDTRTRTRVADIQLEMGCLGCGVPRSLAASPDGARVFAVNRASNTVSVVDTSTRTVITSVPIGGSSSPMPPALAMQPDGTRLYILRGSSILVLDPRTLSPLATIQTTASTNAFDILAAPDGRRLYVMEALGRVLVLDAGSGTLLGSVPVPVGTLSSMDLARDGSRLYVTGNPGFGNPANVAVYDTATLQAVATFTAPSWRVRVRPDDAELWLAGDSRLTILNRSSLSIVNTIPWSLGPQVMDFTPDSSLAFVSVGAGVRVVSTAKGTVVGDIPIDTATEGVPGSIIIPTPPPDPPTLVRVRSIDGPTVTLQWQAPVAGTPPTAYRLEGGINPGETIAALETGSASPVFTFTAPSGSFYVRMRSLNGAMQSAPSNEVRLVTAAAGPPSAPQNLRALVNGAALSLTWRNTFAGGRPDAISIDVSGTVTTSIGFALTEAVAYPTVPPGTYTVRVRATNVAGTSAQSNAVTVTVPGACAGVPDAPVNLVAYRQGSLLSLWWDPAPTGAVTTAYVVAVTGAFNGSLPVTGTAISGTAGPGTYGLSVSGTNACGQGPATPAQTLIVP